MDAEKLQTRKSKITKSIQRTISTAKYESIVIKEQIEEEIEWTKLEERDKKINNWTTILIEQYKNMEALVLKELGLCQKDAYFISHLDKDTRPEPATHTTAASSSVLNELDELDSIGFGK